MGKLSLRELKYLQVEASLEPTTLTSLRGDSQVLPPPPFPVLRTASPGSTGSSLRRIQGWRIKRPAFTVDRLRSANKGWDGDPSSPVLPRNPG